jgi:PAS domain S-box-containing protein
VSPAAVLDALLSATADAVVGIDRSGRITSWNDNAERFSGVPATEAIGTPAVALVPEHLRAELAVVLEAVAAGDPVRHFESEILRRDGMPLPISLTAWPVLDGAEPVAALLVARDITEQRLDQAALAEIEARVREGESLAHVGSWLWDVRTGAVQWSDEFHRIHGIDPLVFDGTVEFHLCCVHADDRDRVKAAMEEAVAGRRPFDAEYRVVRPDGEVRIVHARAQPTLGSAGTALGMRGIGQDVTDRREPLAGSAGDGRPVGQPGPKRWRT